ISDATQDDLPLVFASEGFFKMTGYAPAQILGHSLEKLHGPSTDPRTVKRINQALAAQESVSTCILNYREDGTTFWNHLSLQPVSRPFRVWFGDAPVVKCGVGGTCR
ncbi:hypothetical protein T484DRAFT_1619836, partial [Baffinella frigidus]